MSRDHRPLIAAACTAIALGLATLGYAVPRQLRASAPPGRGATVADRVPGRPATGVPATSWFGRVPVGAVLTRYGIRFRVAPGHSAVVGPAGGRLRRYEVMTQTGTGQSAAAFADAVDAILADPRGWLGSGTWRFQRVSSGHYDFAVELATPDTTDLICGRFGMATHRVVSCRGGPNVVINLDRWTRGSPYYDPVAYRPLVINHEVGHALGHGHVGCPGPGLPAPVMQSQYYGLAGCRRNTWVYVGGRYITGPPVA